MTEPLGRYANYKAVLPLDFCDESRGDSRHLSSAAVTFDGAGRRLLHHHIIGGHSSPNLFATVVIDSQQGRVHVAPTLWPLARSVRSDLVLWGEGG
jgi:hypothetical protein